MRTACSSSHLLGGHAGIPSSPPGVGLETPARPLNIPLGCGPGDPPQARPLNFPLSVGLETYKACWDTTRPTPLWTE